MRAHRMVVQASVSPAGAPQAAVVGAVVTDAFEIVFDTLDSTRKVRNLGMSGQIAFVIGGLAGGEEQTLQYEGVADEPPGAEPEAVRALYFASFPDGRERLSWPGLTYIRAKPTWMRYSDFDRDPPHIVQWTAGQLKAPT